MRSIYTLEVEDNTLEPGDLGYTVKIHEHGEEIGDGVAGNLRAAITEALEQAGILS